MGNPLAAREPLPDNPQYSICPPTDYTRSILVDKTGSNAKTMIEWLSAVRDDGTGQRILLIVGKERPGGENIATSQDFVTGYLSARENRLVNLQLRSAEPFQIDSSEFRRVRWIADELGTGTTISGVLIFCTLGETDIIFDSEDRGPYHRNSLRLAESVASSFRTVELDP